MRDPNHISWAPIHILFLGLSDDPADDELVRRAVAAAARHGIRNNLAAWATAYGEIDGPPAIDGLRALYFEHPPRDPEVLRAVVIAFSTLSRTVAIRRCAPVSTPPSAPSRPTARPPSPPRQRNS